MGATYANRWDAEKARFGDQPVDPETYGTVLAEVGTAANNVANVIDGVGDMIQDTLSSKPMSYEVREATFPFIPQTIATARNALYSLMHFKFVAALGNALAVPGKLIQDGARFFGAGTDTKNHIILQRAA